MNKSELITLLDDKNKEFRYKKIERSVNTILEVLSSSLEKGNRVEIRGFGSFNLNHHAPRKSRNPKTGEQLLTSKKVATRFRPAKNLRERVNNT